MSDQPFPPASNEPVAATATEAALLESALMEMKKVIVGQDRAIERLFVGLLARGHVLLEGVPGLAKTLAVETLAKVIGGRLQPTAVHARPSPRRSRRHTNFPCVERIVRYRMGSGVRQHRIGR